MGIQALILFLLISLGQDVDKGLFLDANGFPKCEARESL